MHPILYVITLIIILQVISNFQSQNNMASYFIQYYQNQINDL